jgi:pyruvate ferredoxin oxidoreductase gamma subunit
MGAPVVSFCRIDDTAIRLREPILEPDAVIIQDPTLLHSINVFSGLNPEGYILINSTRSCQELGIAEFAARFPPHHVCNVEATDLALKHIGRPVPNAALLGGFAAISKLIAFESVAKAIREKFPGPIGDANVAAAREAYEIALTV